MKAVKLVEYLRVSTQKQGRSGLGLEGQRAAVEVYRTSTGGTVAASFTEVESGRKRDRPEFHKALALAKSLRATLVVAKLDRLVRDYHFLRELEASGVDFVACDNPQANKLTVRILAVIAEDEAERISARTKAALQAYKARGGLLGAELVQCRNLDAEAREKGNRAACQAVTEAADSHYQAIYPLLRQWRADGFTLRQMATELNTHGHVTRRGNPFSHVQVKLCLDRADKLGQ